MNMNSQGGQIVRYIYTQLLGVYMMCTFGNDANGISRFIIEHDSQRLY